LLAFSLFFIACSSKSPTTLELSIQTNKNLNQDQSNISSPLMLIFYELESAEKFLKLPYWDVVEESGKKLNNDIVSQTKHIITTNQKQTYKIEFDEKAKFLGVFGQFYNIKKPTWRYLIKLYQNDDNEVELKINNYEIMDLEDE
jgi:type VI secretion system protein VasD